MGQERRLLLRPSHPPHVRVHEQSRNLHPYTLSFFPQECRKVLNYCGSHSGKHVDKVKHCCITPIADSIDDVYFAEARLVLECRKLYFTDINPNASLAQTLVDIYLEKDYHRMFIGEIAKVKRSS